MNEDTPKKGITKITVSGFKSLANETSIEIRPLTILAGANSSGKSSIMQPLLLMKQTLEVVYDPGPLLLNGPNVQFTSSEQIFSKVNKKFRGRFEVEIAMMDQNDLSQKSLRHTFQRNKEGVELTKTAFRDKKGTIVLKANDTTIDDVKPLLSDFVEIAGKFKFPQYQLVSEINPEITIERKRCFFNVNLVWRTELLSYDPTSYALTPLFEIEIPKIIHIPGLRGNPQRTYKTTAVGKEFPGTFENYVASVVHSWQENGDERLGMLTEALEKLGLARRINAKKLDDTQVELRVGRLLRSSNGGEDTVSVADVGFGVSQVLPVLVGLLTAEPGQLVYIEQPELHLHPRAQTALAQILADTAQRGVRVVVETHSSLLLLGVQALVAEGHLAPELIKFHWFQRGDDGVTTVTSAELDENGAFGDWPEDFADVSLEAQSRYIQAVEKREFGG